MKDLVALNLHMIVTIVDGGTGEDVIDFSKEAGAAGGTILHGRGSGVHDSGKFLGLDISPEKDVVLTLVPDSLTNQVMDAIGQGINIDVPGNGICFSIDVDKVMVSLRFISIGKLSGCRNFWMKLTIEKILNHRQALKKNKPKQEGGWTLFPLFCLGFFVNTYEIVNFYEILL